ncbi:MAG: ankyrin repeat domain-containing protein [Gammaproteobacteria bacterium]
MDALLYQVYADSWGALQGIEQIPLSSSAFKRKSSRSTPTHHSQQLMTLMMMELLLNLPQVAGNLQQHPENQSLSLENENKDIELRLRSAIAINDVPGITASMQQVDDISYFFNDLNLTESEKSLVTNPKIPKRTRVSRLLLIAIEKEKVQIADELIKNYDIQLNIADKDGNLLHYAVLHYPQIIPTLVKKGVDPNRMNPMDFAPIHLAASQGKVESLLNLLDAKAKIDLACHKGLTPLFLAIQGGHLEIVEILIKRDANLYVLNSDGVYPIHMAAYFGHIDIVEKLHRAGVDINIKENNGTTVLHLLAYNKNLKGVRRVIALGGDIAAPDSAKNTPFQYAILGGNIEIVKELLDLGAKFQFEHFNILHTAVLNREVSPEIVKFLCDYGVPLHTLTIQGDTPLMIAARRGNVANVEILLQQELNKSTVTKEIYLLRVLAFHMAIVKKHTEVIKVFLKLDSAIRNAKDADGKNARTIAKGDQSLLALLDNIPAPANSQNQEQQTENNYLGHILATLMVGALVLLNVRGVPTVKSLFKLLGLFRLAERDLYSNKKKYSLKTTNATAKSEANVILSNELLSFLGGEKVLVNKTKDNQFDLDTIDFNIDAETTLRLTALDPAITEKYQVLGEYITIPNKLFRKYLSEILEKKIDKERVGFEKVELQEKILLNSNEYIEFIRQQQELKKLKTALNNLAQEIQKRTGELTETYKLIGELQKELDPAKVFAQEKLAHYQEKSEQILRFANGLISFVDVKTSEHQKEISRLQETHDNIAKQYQNFQQKIAVSNLDASKLSEFFEQVNFIDEKLKNYKINLFDFRIGMSGTKNALEEKNNKLKHAIEKDVPIFVAQLPVPIAAPQPPVAPVLDEQQHKEIKDKRIIEGVAPKLAKEKPLIEVINEPRSQAQIEKDSRGTLKGKSKEVNPSSSASSSKKPQQNRTSFFGNSGEISIPSTSRQPKVSVLSLLNAEALRNKALVHAEVISDFPRFMLEYNFEDSTEKAIFYNSLTYNMTCLFVCLWEITLKTGAAPIAEEEQRKWRHFFAHLADRAEINLLTGLAMEFEVGPLLNSNNNSPEVMLQHFQNRQLNNTEFYRHLEREWFNNFRKNPNNNNHEEVAPFFDANECLDRMQLLAKQFVAISNHKKTTSMADDCLDAMKMLLAKIGENAVLLRDRHPEVWEKLKPPLGLIKRSNFIKFRNAVFHEVEIDITDAELWHVQRSMPVVIELLEVIRNDMAKQNEMAPIAGSSYGKR